MRQRGPLRVEPAPGLAGRTRPATWSVQPQKGGPSTPPWAMNLQPSWAITAAHERL